MPAPLAPLHAAQEYWRAAHALQDVPGVKALFLRCYSLYLAGERAKEWVPAWPWRCIRMAACSGLGIDAGHVAWG